VAGYAGENLQVAINACFCCRWPILLIGIWAESLVTREGRYEHDLMKVHAYSYIDTTPNYILQEKVSVQ
jgi:hypothetical protein